jgi:tetratricopeptide (TPR) repeat protein
MRAGDLTEARKDCDLAISMDCNNSDAYWLRAKIRNAIDYRDQASDDAATALRLVNDEIDRGERAAARYVLRSELRLQQGEVEGAVQDAEMAISLNETNASACVVLSQALMKLGKFERALYEADRAAKLNPAKSDAHMARGLGYYYTGKPEEAIQAFSRVIELMPRESFAYLDRGWGRLLLWEKTKGPADLRLADEDFVTATDAAKSAAFAYAGQAWVRYWQHREGAGTLDEAIRFSRLALERDATLGVTHFVRGWIMLAKGQFAEAKTEFSTAIELGSSGPDAHYGLADTERMLGNQDAAIKTYTRAIEKATEAGTGVWHMYYGRALAYAASRNWASASDDYSTTLENAKKSSVTPSQYAGLYADFGWACYELRRDAEMESVFARALELDDKLIHLQLQIAGVRLYSGRYDDALACWNSAISLDPKSSLAYVNRGLTHIYLQDFPAALSDLETALSLDAKDSFAWHTRGWAWVRQGEWKRAVADTDKAIELRSSNEPFRFNNRALARWWLRERSDALVDMRKVLDVLLSGQTGRFPARVREDEVTWGATSEDWTGAVARKPRDFLAHLGRGISRWMAGDLNGARDDLTEARSINARSREVEMVLERVMEELASPLSVA